MYFVHGGRKKKKKNIIYIFIEYEWNNSCSCNEKSTLVDIKQGSKLKSYLRVASRDNNRIQKAGIDI